MPGIYGNLLKIRLRTDTMEPLWTADREQQVTSQATARYWIDDSNRSFNSVSMGLKQPNNILQITFVDMCCVEVSPGSVTCLSEDSGQDMGTKYVFSTMTVRPFEKNQDSTIILARNSRQYYDSINLKISRAT